MNKLILVGNGFDLAHGLPTSYKDFLNDFWKNLHKNYKKEEYRKLVFINENNYRVFNYSVQVETFNDFELNLELYCKEYSHKSKTIFTFKNKFLRVITTKNSIQNWVDLENEYYLQLKKIVKLPKLDIAKSNEQHLRVKKEKTEKHNKEFENIKTLLIKYLKEKVLEKFDVEKIENRRAFLEMYKIFKPNSSLNDNEWNSGDFATTEDNDHIAKVYNDEKEDNTIHCQSYVLNFNYTDSSFLYYLETETSITMGSGNINSIHGEIDSEGFKPVFGFGDEMDEDYQLIENLDDNEYLKFFKSFQYFQNTCYDGLLRFIDNEKFQVCILGHSCGLSDRVMLNTIFEHKNCRSIKIYYHQKTNKKDNYLDITQNISRHFKDKQSMRRKIVSKEFSTPLPQNVRFKKIHIEN